MKIKKNDIVIVTSGKDKGKKGKVLKAFPAEGKIVVEGVGISKKRQRTTKSGQKGQTLNKMMPIKASAVLVFCSACSKGVRVGSKMIGEKKVRICKKCDREV